jgi:hypothetical protein
MKRIAPVLVCCLVLAVAVVAGAAAPPGQQVFVDQKCNNCHSVSSAGIEAKMKTNSVDLAGIGGKKDAAWIKDFIEQKNDLDGKKHKAAFKGTPEQLTQVVDFLAGLK